MMTQKGESKLSNELTHDQVYDDDARTNVCLGNVDLGIVGMAVGAFAALELAFWPANGGIPWITFGRIRPIHTML